jgi:hypothetical protein
VTVIWALRGLAITRDMTPTSQAAGRLIPRVRKGLKEVVLFT